MAFAAAETVVEVLMNAPEVIEKLKEVYEALTTPKKKRSEKFKKALSGTVLQVQYTLEEVHAWANKQTGDDAKELAKKMDPILSDLLDLTAEANELITELETIGRLKYLAKRGDIEKGLKEFRKSLLEQHALLSQRFHLADRNSANAAKEAVENRAKKQAAEEKDFVRLSNLSLYRSYVDELRYAEAEYKSALRVKQLMRNAVSARSPDDLEDRMNHLEQLVRVEFPMLAAAKDFKTAVRRGEIEEARETWVEAFPDDDKAELTDEEFFDARADLLKQAKAAKRDVTAAMRQPARELFDQAVAEEEKLDQETRDAVEEKVREKRGGTEAEKRAAALQDVLEYMNAELAEARTHVSTLGQDLQLRGTDEARQETVSKEFKELFEKFTEAQNEALGDLKAQVQRVAKQTKPAKKPKK